MNKVSISSIAPAIAAALGLAAASAQASSVVLPLGAEHTGSYVEGYFNGGADSQGATSPTNLGIDFSANAQVQKAGNSVSSGNGKFENNPSHQAEILEFASTQAPPVGQGGSLPYAGSSYLNFTQGFTAISFNYALSTNSSAYDTVAQLYSQANGTGTLLGSIDLNASGAANACSSRNDAYCNWIAASDTLASAAESIKFVSSPLAQAGINTLNFAEFDGVTLTPATPVPLPAAVWLLLSGLGGMGALRRRSAV